MQRIINIRLQCQKGWGVMRVLSFLIWLIYISPNLSAQFYDSGQDPAAINWKEIESPYFRVVYDQQIEASAKRFIHLLDSFYLAGAASLDHLPRKLPVVLHSQNVLSNGFVTWAPRRMEIFTVPPQRLKTSEWLAELAAHEYRHVVQIDKLDQGVTKVASGLFGEQVIGALTAFIPLWFFEGDAVAAETALTGGGDGKQAAFKKELKAIELEQDERYSYQKAIFGSYRDFVPDHYRYGYHMASFARVRYGDTVWSQVLDYVGKYPFTLAPFYWGLKKSTGLSKRQLYHQTFQFLKKRWGRGDFSSFDEEKSVIAPSNRTDYLSYRAPVVTENGALLARKDGMDILEQFVIIDSSGVEEHLLTPGFAFGNTLSYADSLLVWGSYIPHIRWQQKNHYVIKILDLRTGKVRILTPGSRLFSPAFKPGGRVIAAVNITQENKSSLVLIDADDGNIIKSFPAPKGHVLQHPSWHPDRGLLLLTAVGRKGKAIFELNTNTGTWRIIKGHSHTNISKPLYYKQFVLYRKDDGGADNLFALDTVNHHERRITNSKYGVYDPEVSTNDGVIYCAEYTSQGYDLIKFPLDSLLKKDLQDIPASDSLHDIILQMEKPFEKNRIDAVHYQVSDYKKAKNLIKIHSWAPFSQRFHRSYDFSDEMLAPGFTFFSQNDLNTMVLEGAYRYQQGSHQVYPKITWAGWFPVFSISADLESPKPHPQYPDYQFDYNRFNASVHLPLNLTRNRMIRGVTPTFQYQYQSYSYYYQEQHLRGFNSNQLAYGINAYQFLKRSERDIEPVFGQFIQFHLTHMPFKSFANARLWMMRGRFHWPGLMNHHIFKTSFGYQVNESAGNELAYMNAPRGYLDADLFAKEYALVKMDYVYPLFYPDWSLSTLAYIKRFRMNIFSDIAWINEGRMAFPDEQFRIPGKMITTGVELLADFHLFQFVFPFTAGTRSTWLQNENKLQWEFLLNVSINR